jgi:P27 family predicted phage terminase small subunit
VGILAPSGILQRADRAALAMYCLAWSRWVKAEGELKTTGEVVRGTQGNAVLNPWLSVSRAAQAQMVKLLSEFGLSPVARHRLLAGQESGEGLADAV